MDILNRISTTLRIGRPTFALTAFVLLLLSGCSDVDLYSNLHEREANEMMAILLDGGISCTKGEGDEDQTWKLKVGSENFSRAVKILTASGYPTDRHVRMGDVFKKSGLVSSPTEDRIRFVYALSEEIAETISRIDGVVDSRVHVVLPDNDPFSDSTKPSSASVYIKHRSDVDLTAEKMEIKDLVAKSIEGLASDEIEVFLDEVEPIAPPPEEGASYSQVFGITIATTSLKKFWIIGGSIAGIAVLCLVLTLWLGWRDYQSRHKSATQNGSGGSTSRVDSRIRQNGTVTA
ncbi:type III secretion system inner membrane ring lipoprotein SctJ [Thalassoglobus sp. JC818]|uniref:type III secretion system inner membrane ring lipoprotein SctJ n=1 Tax=Thalassoglobus sp. JC818 TaxID=3232136 RepID=UPI0034588304